MPEGEDWTRIEVEACVADYLHMLTLELNGQSYNKTAHAQALMARLNGRSRGSVEFKHCNISAVLTDLRYPCIRGYLPRWNYQALLLDVVEAQAANNPALHAAAEAEVQRPAAEIRVPDDDEEVWVSAPVATSSGIQQPFTPYRATADTRRPSAARDYLAQEARNRSLGTAGEHFVLELESRRLHAAGKRSLSERIEHVAATQGDGAGYDIQSFEVDGRERLIEVKTTSFGKLTPFFVTRNELRRSEADAPTFHLYRVFEFRRKPRLFQLPGAISGHCQLMPVSFLAQFKTHGA